MFLATAKDEIDSFLVASALAGLAYRDFALSEEALRMRDAKQRFVEQILRVNRRVSTSGKVRDVADQTSTDRLEDRMRFAGSRLPDRTLTSGRCAFSALIGNQLAQGESPS